MAEDTCKSNLLFSMYLENQQPQKKNTSATLALSQESVTYVNRVLAFMFATDESFEKLMALPKVPRRCEFAWAVVKQNGKQGNKKMGVGDSVSWCDMTCPQATVDNLMFDLNSYITMWHYVLCTSLYTLSWVLRINALTKILFFMPCTDWIGNDWKPFSCVCVWWHVIHPKKQKRVCICLHAGLCHFLDSSSSIAESSQEPFRMNCGDQLCVTWLMIQRGNCLGKQKVVFVWLCVPSKSFVILFSIVVVVVVVIIAVYLAVWLANSRFIWPTFPWPRADLSRLAWEKKHFCSRHLPLSEGSRRS